MPKAAPTTRLSFKTYQHLLDVLVENAMTVVHRVAAELKPEQRETPPIMDFSTVARNFAILTGLVRRSIVVSRYIDTLPVPTEEREHRLGPALDRVFRLFATRKITVAEYNRAMDAELDGDIEEELEDALLDGKIIDGENRMYHPDGDVPGRPPAALVAELCRDFGMMAHSLPAEWLAPVSTELRLLCARAAAAAIRPSGPPVRVGRMLAG